MGHGGSHRKHLPEWMWEWESTPIEGHVFERLAPAGDAVWKNCTRFMKWGLAAGNVGEGLLKIFLFI